MHCFHLVAHCLNCVVSRVFELAHKTKQMVNVGIAGRLCRLDVQKLRWGTSGGRTGKMGVEVIFASTFEVCGEYSCRGFLYLWGCGGGNADRNRHPCEGL